MFTRDVCMCFKEITYMHVKLGSNVQCEYKFRSCGLTQQKTLWVEAIMHCHHSQRFSVLDSTHCIHP